MKSEISHGADRLRPYIWIIVVHRAGVKELLVHFIYNGYALKPRIKSAQVSPRIWENKTAPVKLDTNLVLWYLQVLAAARRVGTVRNAGRKDIIVENMEMIVVVVRS